MIFALLATVAHAAPPPDAAWPEPVVRYASDLHPFRVDSLHRFDLLDVSDTHAAIKVVHALEADPEFDREPIDCGYAGMKDEPLAGVALVVFDLAKNTEPDVFEVYKPVLDKDECLSHEASEKALTAAKARIAEVGLDIARKPAPLEDATVKRPWGEAKIETESTTSTQEAQGSLRWEVETLGHRLYASTKGFTLMMAGSAKMVGAQMWATPSGFVVLEHTEYFSGRGGTSHELGFTPVLKIP
jgi:hypothetical protein